MKKLIALMFVGLIVVTGLGCGGSNQQTVGEGQGELLRENPRAHRYDRDGDGDANVQQPEAADQGEAAGQ